ncbi:MAG: hypothetical protein H5U39_07885, partial [Deferribacterales bacterium]|nr:hypothetical protein [Deferribacterales bacterium]
FVDVKEDDILQETSLPEIKAIFSSESFYNTLFRDKELFDNFFEPIENSNKRYTISWKVLRGLKI